MSFDWLKPKSRVSIIVCMENMHGNIRFTPLYATAYAIMNSMENLRLDKEGLFPKFSFPRVKRTENIFSVFPHVIETLVEVW